MVPQRLLGERVPPAGSNFSLEFFVPDLVLVFFQPDPQFTKFGAGENAQLVRNFLNAAHSGLLSDGSRLFRAWRYTRSYAPFSIRPAGFTGRDHAAQFRERSQIDEGNRMSEKSWASLAPLLDNRIAGHLAE